MLCRPFRPSEVSSPSPTEETEGLWVSRVAGLGFCEAQKGGCFVIAWCFDHVSGNYSWVRTETYLLKESFPLAPTPLGKLLLLRGWARPLTLQSGAPRCLKVISSEPWDSLGSGGTRARFGNRVSPLGRSSWHPHPPPAS